MYRPIEQDEGLVYSIFYQCEQSHYASSRTYVNYNTYLTSLGKSLLAHSKYIVIV